MRAHIANANVNGSRKSDAFGKLLVDSTYPARLAPYETGVSQRVTTNIIGLDR